MLAGKFERWVKEWKEQGLKEGRAEGREEGREEGRAEALVTLIRRHITAGHLTLADGIAQIEGLAADGVRVHGHRRQRRSRFTLSRLIP